MRLTCSCCSEVILCTATATAAAGANDLMPGSPLQAATLGCIALLCSPFGDMQARAKQSGGCAPVLLCQR